MSLCLFGEWSVNKSLEHSGAFSCAIMSPLLHGLEGFLQEHVGRDRVPACLSGFPSETAEFGITADGLIPRWLGVSIPSGTMDWSVLRRELHDLMASPDNERAPGSNTKNMTDDWCYTSTDTQRSYMICSDPTSTEDFKYWTTNGTIKTRFLSGLMQFTTHSVPIRAALKAACDAPQTTGYCGVFSVIEIPS